jgi:hypothetical protein
MTGGALCGPHCESRHSICVASRGGEPGAENVERQVSEASENSASQRTFGVEAVKLCIGLSPR